MSRARKQTAAQPHPTAAVALPPKAIITPAVDALCCGGFSILLIGGYLISFLVAPPQRQAEVNIPVILLLTALVNWPHFMASYRLLYYSREQVRQYRWASIYVPAILVFVALLGIATAPFDTMPGYVNLYVIEAFLLVSSAYLAWHYTGQAWGMTAVFMHLSGIRMESAERRLIRFGYRVLLVFHVAWVLAYVLPHMALGAGWYPSVQLAVAAVYGVSVVGALISIPLGLYGFHRIRRRTGIPVPWRAVLPWVAIYLWYLVIHVRPDTDTFLLLQVSHALQYIIFPIRVEMNRCHSAETDGRKTHTGAHMLLYYATLLLAGVVFFIPEFLWEETADIYPLFVVITASINIHHYFVDGVIWKISNPRVRKELFAHLEART